MEIQISSDKIIEKSKQWTLEGDCSLLQWMNQISNNLEERVTKTSSALTEMSTKLDRTSIALSNATNSLAALQYSKFVENRVHEDDETLANTANVPKEDVTDKNNVSQDIYSFLKKNIEMMNSCHEAYSISYEDSDDDDEEPVTSVVYRSKNPYEARPLPHIYGSTMWKQKWHIGLCDSDNDFSGEENSEQFSESSSTADDSYESTAPTMSEWDSTAWGLNTQHNVERKGVQTPSNDGESSYQGEDYSQSKVSTPRTERHVPTAQQPSPDQRYYVHVPRRKENLFDDIFDDSKPQEVAPKVVPPQVVPPQVISAPQKKIISESYIPNEPPPDEQPMESDSNRRVGAKKTLNLFDDDEFSSFMDQIVQKAANKNIKPIEQPEEKSDPPKKSGAPNLFENYVPSDYDSQKQTKKTVGPNLFDDSNDHKPKAPSKAVAPNLFGDSDGLFSSSPPEKGQEPPKKIIAPNLFNDSDDLFPPSLSKQPIVMKKPHSPSSDDDIFTATPHAVTVIGKTKIKNLFDDDDEDDDFDNIFSSKPNTSNTFSQATKNLFSDDLAVEPIIQDSVLKDGESIENDPKTSKEVFNDGKDINALEKEKVPNVQLAKESPAVQKSIFDDGDDVSHIIEKKVIAPVPKEASSLIKKGLFDDFDELEDENDIFSTKPAKKDDFENLFEKEKPDNKLSKIQNKSLFGDDDAEEDSGGSTKQVDENKPSNSDSISNLTNKTPDDVRTLGQNIQKTQDKDIFADDDLDDFDNFISTIPPKPDKVDENHSKISQHPTKPIETPTETLSDTNEPTSISATAPSLPVISRKPLVDKTLKPQSKNMSKNLIAELSKKLKDTNNFNPTIAREETEKVPGPNAENSHPTLESFENISKTYEAAKTQIDGTSGSKQNSTLDVNVSESTEQFGTKNQQTKDKESFNDHENNTQTKLVYKADEELSKPVPNPKPVVMIEHDKIVSPSKETIPVAENASTKKSSTIPSYTSLFHDDIPPEDENPNPTSNEESPLHTVEEDVEIKKPLTSGSSVPYSSLNLFADVPPDDYFTVSTPPTPPVTQTKRIHSVFYDDFNETIEAGREMRAPSNYMINDEPPPDYKDNKPVSSEVKKEKNNKPVTSEVKKEKDNKPVTSEIKKEKPQVSKLKTMNIQINVGALLPSAKLPSFKKPETVAKPQPEILINEQNTPSLNDNNIVPIQSPAEKTRDLPENILPNLNKDRAKVQVKRRPSTRTGRQERYRKSMIEETVSNVNQEEENVREDLEKREQLGSKDLADIAVDKQESKEKAQTSSPPKDFGILDENLETTEEPKANFSKLPDQATLFEESDIFFNKTAASSASSKATTTKIPSLFKSSDSELENKLETIKTKANKSEPDSSPSLTKNFDSLFDSDGIDENPFGTPKNFVPPPVTPKETNNPPQETKSKLDLLFDSVQPKEQSIKTAFKQPAKSTSKSLFGDSDDGSDDDLFKEARISKKPVSHTKPDPKTIKKQTKPSASLFSSDEGSGSGDDLFGKAKTKTATQKNEPVKDKASSSLFADSSDDDSDSLFGTPSTKVNKSKANPPKSRLPPTKQPVQAQPAKTISSNPLSDLLGP